MPLSDHAPQHIVIMVIIFARRAGAWNQVSSDEIVPEDLISPTHYRSIHPQEDET